MFGRKKKPPECLPWYRARDYKGDLTENEKRQLDFVPNAEGAPCCKLRHPSRRGKSVRGFNFPAHKILRVSEGVENLLR